MLIARMVAANFGTRIYYVSLGGFDTHGDQREGHAELLTQLSNGINSFYAQLDGTGDAERVLLMTFSEFGRRVDENGSKGTDHGAGSCMFLAGPAVKSGPIGEHPSLNSLYRGDLVHHTDFRQVYATVLDRWLECNSRHVLDGAFEHVDALA